MKKNEEVLLPLLDQLADGICLTSRGRIFYLNAAAEKLLAVSLEKARGISLCDLLCGHLSGPSCTDCAAHCVLRRPDGAEQAVAFEGRYGRSAFGWREPKIDRIESSRDLRVRCLKAAPRPDSDPPDVHLTIIEDVTARENLEKEREDWRSMIAHDLRSPLTSVFGILRTMQEGIENGAPPELDPQMIEIGVRNCRRMIDLVNLYLDVAKLEAGQMKADVKELELAEIVRRCVEEQLPAIRERRVAFAVNVPAGLKVLADAEMLARVVMNLLDNAVKFTPEGGRVELSAGPAGRDAAQFAVADTGPGIAPEEIPRLFDRYHQAKVRREGKVKGTGLGLAFCRQALSAMNGTVCVESKPGEGSRFIVRVPAPRRRVNGRARGRSP